MMESESLLHAKTKPKLFCFVLMPFSSDFDDVYKIGIKEACETAGSYCERVDEQIFSERILDRIYNQIAKADVVIADMTGRNANVFYEVGYAHALGKPTVLLTRDADDIPFDLKHFPHIVYQSKLSFLREKIVEVIRWYAANPGASLEDTSFPFELVIDGVNPLSSKVCLCVKGAMNSIGAKITVHNRSSGGFNRDEFKLGVLVSDEVSVFHSVIASETPVARMGEGKLQYIFRADRSLMPGEFQEFPVTFYFEPAITFDRYEAQIRILTAKGFRDFPFALSRSSETNAN